MLRFLFIFLLAKEWQSNFVIAGEHKHVIAFAAAPPQADDAARPKPMLGDDLVEHLLGVGEQ